MSRIIETITKYATHKPCKTAEQMEKICCVPTAELICCEKKEPWGGYSADEVMAKAGISVNDQGMDSSGRYVEVRFTERTKACGEKKTKYDTTPKTCCDEVEPLAVDTENSVEIIADYSNGMIYVTGGKLPLQVRVFGTGFYVANTRNPEDGFRNAEVWGRTIPIKTLDACGTGTYLIGDGCSLVECKVYSTTGSYSLQETWPAGFCGGTFSAIMSRPAWLSLGEYTIPSNIGHVYGDLVGRLDSHTWGEGGVVGSVSSFFCSGGCLNEYGYSGTEIASCRRFYPEKTSYKGVSNCSASIIGIYAMYFDEEKGHYYRLPLCDDGYGSAIQTYSVSGEWKIYGWGC